MRLWSRNIQPYLPDLQFKGQLREIILIMHDWRDKGKTNHLLINKIMEYDKKDLYYYFDNYEMLYFQKYGKLLPKHRTEFQEFANVEEDCVVGLPYQDWLEIKEHLRIEMANLYEKHLGVGKSRISDSDWQRLLDGYKTITNEDYVL